MWSPTGSLSAPALPAPPPPRCPSAMEGDPWVAPQDSLWKGGPCPTGSSHWSLPLGPGFACKRSLFETVGSAANEPSPWGQQTPPLRGKSRSPRPSLISLAAHPTGQTSLLTRMLGHPPKSSPAFEGQFIPSCLRPRHFYSTSRQHTELTLTQGWASAW